MSHYLEANTVMGAVANEVAGHGGGKTYPGAVVPFGMVQLSPDTITGGDNGAGYSYGHPTIEGFSWVHMSGIGWYGDFGNLQVMPISGSRRYFSGTNEYRRLPIGETGWESHFDHATEVTRPGYYAVDLTDYDIRTEAVAARHTGVLRFTFRRKGESHIVLDLHRRIGGHSNVQTLRVISPDKLEGRIICTPEGGGWGHGHGGVRYEISFVIELSRPMDGWAFWDEGKIYEGGDELTGNSLGFCADYNVSAGEQIELHAAISFVDLEGAYNNFRCENAPFDTLRQRAENEWTQALNLIDVEGGSDRDREIFYSSLYHATLDPRDFSDCDGRYRLAMRRPEKATEYTCRTIFSGWDVFRSTFPLFSLIRPDVVRDQIRSLIQVSEINGNASFARWEIVGLESGCMVGDPGANILGDAVIKGIPGIESEKAYQICRLHWLGEKSGEGHLKNFNQLGYFVNDISNTFEYSFTAWCLGKVAEALGHKEDAEEFYRRSLNYRLLYNAENGWPTPRDESGSFCPFKSKYDERGCVESNIYQQTWFVPHDIKGLQSLMGEERFVRELDEFFEKADLSAFWNDDYNHSNEPVHTVPHIFDQIGQPHKTQYWVRRIQKEAYRTGAYGYCGNEDVGQMSAWFVLTAMGIHQSALASNRFELNTPLFPKVTLTLCPGTHALSVSDKLEISTDLDPETHPYIAGVELNGKAIDRPWLSWEEVTSGGVLRFRLSETPTSWGV